MDITTTPANLREELQCFAGSIRLASNRTNEANDELAAKAVRNLSGNGILIGFAGEQVIIGASRNHDRRSLRCSRLRDVGSLDGGQGDDACGLADQMTLNTLPHAKGQRISD